MSLLQIRLVQARRSATGASILCTATREPVQLLLHRLCVALRSQQQHRRNRSRCRRFPPESAMRKPRFGKGSIHIARSVHCARATVNARSCAQDHDRPPSLAWRPLRAIPGDSGNKASAALKPRCRRCRIVGTQRRSRPAGATPPLTNSERSFGQAVRHFPRAPNSYYPHRLEVGLQPRQYSASTPSPASASATAR